MWNTPLSALIALFCLKRRFPAVAPRYLYFLHATPFNPFPSHRKPIPVRLSTLFLLNMAAAGNGSIPNGLPEAAVGSCRYR